MADESATNGKNTPGGGDNARRELAALCLARGWTITAAAEEARIGERTLHRWVRRASFSALVREARAKLFTEAYAKLADLSGTAVDKLKGLLSSANESVRLGAIKTVLASSIDLRESLELAEKVAELDKLLTEMKAHAAAK